MNVQIAYYELVDMFLALRQLFSGERFRPYNSIMTLFEDKLTTLQLESIQTYGILTNGYLAALQNLISMKLNNPGSDDTHLFQILETPHILFTSEYDQINDEQVQSQYESLIELYQSDPRVSQLIRATVAALWKDVFSSVKSQHSRIIFEKISQLQKAIKGHDVIDYLSSCSDRFFVDNDVLKFQIKPEYSIKKKDIENIIIMPSLYSSRDLTFWYENNNLIFFISPGADHKENIDPSDMLLLITSAFNDRSRLKILKLLHQKNCTAGDLAESLHLNASTVSRHLKIFKDTGMIDIFSNDGKKIVYTVNQSGLDSASKKLSAYLKGKE